jgi:cardiolipin synthase
VVAALTDGMDGLLARSLNQKTALGAYLDPIADKLLLSSSFVVLAFEGQIRWWLTILVLGRDVLILTTAAVILVAGGYRRFPPSIYGKITTTVQILLVFTVLAAAVFHGRTLHVRRAGADLSGRGLHGLFGISLQRGRCSPPQPGTETKRTISR